MPKEQNHFHLPAIDSEIRSLNYDSTYRCPVCQHGQIQTLALMETFACSFCRHLFIANLEAQTLSIADSVQPAVWSWTGRRWQPAQRYSQGTSLFVWFASAILLILPVTLILLAAILFPPAIDAPFRQLPVLWAGMTFAVHGSFVGWLLCEYHQFPLYITSKIRFRRFLEAFR